MAITQHSPFYIVFPGSETPVLIPGLSLKLMWKKMSYRPLGLRTWGAWGTSLVLPSLLLPELALSGSLLSSPTLPLSLLLCLFLFPSPPLFSSSTRDDIDGALCHLDHVPFPQ